MRDPFLELPAAGNSNYSEPSRIRAPAYRQQVHVVFNDGTQVSIDLEIATRVNATHYRCNRSDGLKVLHQDEEAVMRAWCHEPMPCRTG